MAVVSVLLGVALGDSFESASSPAALTYGTLVFSCVGLIFFGFYTFDARRIRARMAAVDRPDAGPAASSMEGVAPKRLSSLLAQAPPRSLDDIGKMLAALAATLLVQPLLLGLVVFTITGDLWRQLLFLPVALLAGAAYWLRIRVALERLQESGLN